MNSQAGNAPAAAVMFDNQRVVSSVMDNLSQGVTAAVDRMTQATSLWLQQAQSQSAPPSRNNGSIHPSRADRIDQASASGPPPASSP
jgi:hypothetical protein